MNKITTGAVGVNAVGIYKKGTPPAEALGAAQKAGEELRTKVGGKIVSIANVIPPTTLNFFANMSRFAGAAIQEKGLPVPKPGARTITEALEEKPFLSKVVEEKIRKIPVIGKIPGVAVGGGFLSEFLLPPYGPGKSGNFLADLARTILKNETKNLLLKGIKNISKSEADVLAAKLAPITNKKLIQAELDTFVKSKAEMAKISPKIEARALPVKAKAMPQEAQSIKAVQELAQGQPSGLKTPLIPPEPIASVSKAVSYADDTATIGKGQTINTSKLNISDEGKKLIENEIEAIKPRLEEKIGKTLTNKEAQELADESSKILKRAVGQEQTLEWEAAMLKLRQRLARAAESGQVTKEFIDDLVSVKTLGTDLGRKLQSLSIEADPKLITAKQSILSEILKITDDSDTILKAAQGVDFNDFNQAANFYRQFIKPSLVEWVDLVRYNSMLSSPLTHMVNIFSNLTNSTLRAPLTKLVTGGVDLLSSAATGKARTQFAGEAGAYISGYLSSFQEAFKNLAGVWKGTRQYTHLDLRRQIPLSTKGAKGALVKTLSVPMRLLEGADQFFMALVGGGERAALKLRAGKGVKVKAVEEQAELSARYGLFRQELFAEGQGTLLDAIDTFTSKVLSLRNSPNPIVSTIAKFTVPFVSTPMNLFKQGIEYSPIGFATAIKSVNKIEQFSKALIGTSIAVTAGTLIAANRMTWGEPRNTAERNAFREAGMQPYSVKLGDRWYSYQKLPPFISFPLSMVALVHDAQKERKLSDTQAEFVLSSFAKYAEFLADQSYFKSIGDFFDAMSGNEFAISRLIGNYPQQLVPFRAFGGWMARLTDGLQRQIDNQADFIDKQVQLLMLNVPFVSQRILPRVGPSGEPIEARDRFIGAVSPIRTIKQTPEEMKQFQETEKLRQLNREESQRSAILKQDAITLDAEFKALSPAEANIRVRQIKSENPALYEKLKDTVEERKLGLTYTEKLMKQLGVKNGERAKYIHEQIMKLPQPERQKYYEELKMKKIISTTVVGQLKTMILKIKK
ncbi:MAG: Phage-related protein [Candidatus Nomurabacteria bacterium GW2011_GWC2_39_41]|uniref:Phage-related protein n=1 Tax=Candidatus Nomurabacteria bacterium GW2011_GWC2_39_41 TaxID=1618754 RepID=A0A837HT64_9BACT|nr:MAG: Phage-related protein [Candidatus Nomurabacteria bacterium GW2011_GWC2_39_41]